MQITKEQADKAIELLGLTGKVSADSFMAQVRQSATNPHGDLGVELVSGLGLTEELHPDKIRASDAARYVAKVLHEGGDVAARADEVVVHLGLTEEGVIDAFKERFGVAAAGLAEAQ
jgi:hypothetical protein